jgi:integrase
VKRPRQATSAFWIVSASRRAAAALSRTEEAYSGWVRRFVLFHGKRHPDQLGSEEVTAFLSDLAVRARVSASTQNQALGALLFLYRHVLGRELEGLGSVVRASNAPRHLPVVLARGEVRGVFEKLDGVYRLVAVLLYGGGLRLMEALRLRVKDVDLRASDRGAVRKGSRCVPLLARQAERAAISTQCTGCTLIADGLDGAALGRSTKLPASSRRSMAVDLPRRAPEPPGGAPPSPHETAVQRASSGR